MGKEAGKKAPVRYEMEARRIDCGFEQSSWDTDEARGARTSIKHC